jgi:hypothetical protein
MWVSTCSIIGWFVGPHIETRFLGLVILYHANKIEQKGQKQGVCIMTKVKLSLGTWLKCKLMIALVQRRSPVEEG